MRAAALAPLADARGLPGYPAGAAASARQRRPAVVPCAGACGDVVTLIDDDDVPPGVLKIVAILKIILQGVDRDDAAVEIIERVVVAGNAVAHPRQPQRIQAHQRNRKAAPPLLLELHEGRDYAPCSPWVCRCSGPLHRKALRGHNGINLFLAGDKIGATARVTFDEAFIDNAIACLLASGAKTPRGNLDRLAIVFLLAVTPGAPGGSKHPLVTARAALRA